ncbi:MAG: hypothetical protein ABJB16_04410 [Saprospiraceae bacterium]
MKYLKLFILLYTCIQLSYCNAKNDTAQKVVDGSTAMPVQMSSAEVTNNGPLNKSVFLKAIASLKSGEVLDTVSLKNMLSQSLMNLNRVSYTGKRVKQKDNMVSTSEANYKTNGKMLYVTITDAGKDSTYLMTLAPWAAMQFQNIRGDGYEKSIILDGSKIDEKYNSASHTANLAVMYNSRILVELIGTNCSVEELYSIIK